MSPNEIQALTTETVQSLESTIDQLIESKASISTFSLMITPILSNAFERCASGDDTKALFKKLALHLHPDKSENNFAKKIAAFLKKNKLSDELFTLLKKNATTTHHPIAGEFMRSWMKGCDDILRVQTTKELIEYISDQSRNRTSIYLTELLIFQFSATELEPALKVIPKHVQKVIFDVGGLRNKSHDEIKQTFNALPMLETLEFRYVCKDYENNIITMLSSIRNTVQTLILYWGHTLEHSDMVVKSVAISKEILAALPASATTLELHGDLFAQNKSIDEITQILEAVPSSVKRLSLRGVLRVHEKKMADIELKQFVARLPTSITHIACDDYTYKFRESINQELEARILRANYNFYLKCFAAFAGAAATAMLVTCLLIQQPVTVVLICGLAVAGIVGSGIALYGFFRKLPPAHPNESVSAPHLQPSNYG